jgi:DNA-binding NtrC family response regulator
MGYRVLVVDDDAEDNRRYCLILRNAGHQVQGVRDGVEAVALVTNQAFDVLVLDMMLLPPLPDQNPFEFAGIEVLRRSKAHDPQLQVIAITGYSTNDLKVQAISLGAWEYLIKDRDTIERLPGSVHVAGARAEQVRGISPHFMQFADETKLTIPEYLVAESNAMRQLLRSIHSIAGLESPMIITGESGVGKVAIASLVHLNSLYSRGEFVIVPCQRLSTSLVELWGTANDPKSGYCARASGGTLVLKSVHQLSIEQQEQISDFVERWQYRPVGSQRTQQVHLRIIATTNIDVERWVRQSRFLGRLYSAFKSFTIQVPPLRERRDDIPAIAAHLLHTHHSPIQLDPESARIIASYDYLQSNITELQTILTDAANIAAGQIIQPHHLPRNLCDRRSFINATTSQEPLELSLRFVPGDPNWVLWYANDGDDARSIFKLPYDTSTLPLVLRALDAIQWPNHPIDGPTFSVDECIRLEQLELWDGKRIVPDIGRRVGQKLYQAIVADSPAWAKLDAVRKVVTRQQRLLKLILRFPPEATTIAALPWELLWDEQHPLLLSRSRLASCERYLDISHPMPFVPVTGRKLRMLALCPQLGIPEQLHLEEENGRLKAFQNLQDTGRLDVEEMRPVYKTDLTDRFLEGEAIDILHFYGHGLWKNNEAFLQLDDGLISASQLATLVGNTPLVVLHACRSGQVGSDDLFTGIAPMLSAEGVTIVVAMQFTVSVKAANRFATVFYRNLAKGESVQTAVTKARQALYVEHPESWYVPVVYIRSHELGQLTLVQS